MSKSEQTAGSQDVASSETVQRRGEVLVALMPSLLDFAIAQEQHWYRIPATSVKKWLSSAWPPRWLAFYAPKVFGPAAFAINCFAPVIDIRSAYRWQLFPDEPHDEKSERLYHQVVLGPLQTLERPIRSYRLRRITFIPTTWSHFTSATEINDLYHGNPIEDMLWHELKRLQIPAERQEEIQTKSGFYFLDFAIHCAKGDIDLETDGDTWHANPKKAQADNTRDNELEVCGWHVLRFRSQIIKEQMAAYCIPKVVKEINNCGGLAREEGTAARKINLAAPPGSYQPSLLD